MDKLDNVFISIGTIIRVWYMCGVYVCVCTHARVLTQSVCARVMHVYVRV